MDNKKIMKKQRNREKKASYKIHTVKIIMFLMITLTLLTSISAWEFDNIKSYDPVTKTIDIRNSVLGIPFLQLSKVAEIKLNTPTNYYIIRGENRKVAEFEINNFDVYNNAFKDLKFYHVSQGMTEFERDFTYKYEVVTGTKEVPVYKEVCEDIIEKNNSITKKCNEIVDYYNNVNVTEWKEFSIEQLPKGKITIGIFTEVKEDDKVEWIPTLFGVEIDEWATWTESLNVGLVAYWNMDTAYNLTNIEDQVTGIHNASAVLSGFVYNKTNVVLGNSTTWNGDDGNDVPYHTDLEPANNLTICVWTYKFDGNYRTIINRDRDASGGAYSLRIGGGGNANKFLFTTYVGSLAILVSDVHAVNNAWYFVCVMYNNTAKSIWVDGVQETQAVLTGNLDYSTNANQPVNIGYGKLLGAGIQYWYKEMDEMGFWNRSLSATEITQLYNGGTGMTYIIPPDVTKPNIIIKSPTNTSYTSVQTELNYTATDDGGLDRCWYSTNNGATNSSTQTCNSNWTGLTSTENSNTWIVYANDTSGNENSTSMTFLVDTISPEINITYPQNTSYTELITRINITYIEINPDSCWYSNDSGVINSTGQSCDTNFTSLTYGQGSYKIITYINDTANHQNYSNFVTFFVDSINPDINIVFPASNLTNSSDYDYNVNYTYTETNPDSCWWSDDWGTTNNSLTCGENITDIGGWPIGLNHVIISINDTLGNMNSTSIAFTIDTSKPTFTLISPTGNSTTNSLPTNVTLNVTTIDATLNSCWYSTNENTTNTTYACNTAINVSFANEGEYTITYCADDSVGNENCSSVSYSINYYTYDQSFTPSFVGEGGSVTFTLYVNSTNIPDTVANITINNTEYTDATKTKYTNYTTFVKTLIIPDGYGSSTGNAIDNFWNFSISGIADVDTSIQQLTVYEMTIDDCSVYNETILNLTLRDEEGNNIINASVDATNVEIDLTLTGGTEIWTYSNQWINNTDSITICISDNLLNNTEYQIDFTIGFYADDHVNEFYYLDNGTLDNSSSLNSLTDKNINLMDLLTADSTSFLFNYFDTDGLIVDNIIVHVFRKYIGEGLFREVERSKQNDDGDTIVHLVEEDVIYYFVISQSSTILFTSNTYTALCQTTPCEIQLEESGGFQAFDTDWDLVDNGGYTIVSSSRTRIVNLTYSLTTPSTMNLTIYKLESDGSYDIVGSQQDTATSGSLLITVPVISGNTSFFASVYQDDTFLKSEWIDFEEDAGIYFGNTLSLFLGALIILALGLMAVAEGGGVIIFLILGMFIAMILGLVDYRTSAGLNILIYFMLAGGIILWKITRRNR